MIQRLGVMQALDVGQRKQHCWQEGAAGTAPKYPGYDLAATGAITGRETDKHLEGNVVQCEQGARAAEAPAPVLLVHQGCLQERGKHRQKRGRTFEQTALTRHTVMPQPQQTMNRAGPGQVTRRQFALVQPSLSIRSTIQQSQADKSSAMA